MEKNKQLHLQELIFSSSNPEISRQISKLEKLGEIRKISPRVYSSNFEDAPENIIRRNIFLVLGNLYPDAILSHRSALEFKLTDDFQIFVTHSYTKKVTLPGVTINFLKGESAIEGDKKFSGDLYVSSQERAFLENLQTSRSANKSSKTLTQDQLEIKLEKIFQIKGEEGLNEFRDIAREISEKLRMQSEFRKLNKIISALLKTRPSKLLTSPVARARALGEPFDENRMQLFEKLFIYLKKEVIEELPDKNIDSTSFRNLAFFDAYFSNYIEGTVFEVDEAKEIITSETPLPNRGEDSHDILGTYKLVSNKKEMSVVPQSGDDLINILQYRHKILLEARQSKNPGVFKDKNNRAGETHFVDFPMVKGTLKKGFEFYNALKDSFARAVYMMFLISEVHPFLDGNGRIARIMMNAELVNKRRSRIIIPTVYRDDYLGGLRKLTRTGNPEIYVKMLNRAQKFSFSLDGSNMERLEDQLMNTNAFKESDEAVLKF